MLGRAGQLWSISSMRFGVASPIEQLIPNLLLVRFHADGSLDSAAGV